MWSNTVPLIMLITSYAMKDNKKGFILSCFTPDLVNWPDKAVRVGDFMGVVLVSVYERGWIACATCCGLEHPVLGRWWCCRVKSGAGGFLYSTLRIGSWVHVGLLLSYTCVASCHFKTSIIIIMCLFRGLIQNDVQDGTYSCSNYYSIKTRWYIFIPVLTANQVTLMFNDMIEVPRNDILLWMLEPPVKSGGSSGEPHRDQPRRFLRRTR